MYQKFLTKEIAKKLPPLYGTEGTPVDEKKIIVKYFNPSGAQTWYMVEYDPIEKIFFGMSDLYGNQYDMSLGYISQAELESFRGKFGLKIERDMWWNENTTIGDVKSKKVR